MKSIEELCGQLTADDLLNLSQIRWERAANSYYTFIPYTFDITNLVQSLVDSINKNHGSTVNFAVLPAATQTIVANILIKWESACNHYVRFSYLPVREAGQAAITFASCDNITSFSGITAWSGTRYFDNALVCFPSIVSDSWRLATITHEVGHALGIKHTHNLLNLQQRLQNTSQGLGCSVMGYVSAIKSDNNLCSTAEYCLNETYAVHPGPLDKQICRMLYKVPASAGALATYGCLNGALEPFLVSFIAGLEYNDQKASEFTSRVLSLTLTLLVRLLVMESGYWVPIIMLCFELFTSMCAIDRDGWLNILKEWVIAAMLFASIFMTYLEGDMLPVSACLLLFLAANTMGGLLGKALGSPAAKLINGLANQGKHACGFGFFDRKEGNLLPVNHSESDHHSTVLTQIVN